MPLVALPEITFLAAAVVPPIVLLVDPDRIKIPLLFATAASPAALTPMKLPKTVLEFDALISTPCTALPEITFPAPEAVPPMVLELEDSNFTPCPPLPSA